MIADGLFPRDISPTRYPTPQPSWHHNNVNKSLITHQWTTAVMGLRILINVNNSLNAKQWTSVMGLRILINVNKSLNTHQWTTCVMWLGILPNENKSLNTPQ
jgi:hypothetical protein